MILLLCPYQAFVRYYESRNIKYRNLTAHNILKVMPTSIT